MYELLGKNRIFNYVPSHYVDRIPSANRDPLLIRVNEAMVFFYNTELHPDSAPISNVWELTQEKYRGRVEIKNPNSKVKSDRDKKHRDFGIRALFNYIVWFFGRK